jgi:hypothetical protein
MLGVPLATAEQAQSHVCGKRESAAFKFGIETGAGLPLAQLDQLAVVAAPPSHAPAATAAISDGLTRHVASSLPPARTANPIAKNPAPVALATLWLLAFHQTSAFWLICPETFTNSRGHRGASASKAGGAGDDQVAALEL